MSADDKTKPTVSTFTPTSRKRTMLIAAGSVIVIVVAIVFVILMNRDKGQSDTEVRQQHVLQTSLQTSVYKATDQNAVVRDATSLIKGVNEGRFVLSDAELGKLYLTRGNAYMVLKNYKDASADYDIAAKKDSNVRIASLQGEIEARYRMGERKSLIELYNQLITAMQKSTNPLAGDNVAQYKGYIKLLEAGKDLEL